MVKENGDSRLHTFVMKLKRLIFFCATKAQIKELHDLMYHHLYIEYIDKLVDNMPKVDKFAGIFGRQFLYYNNDVGKCIQKFD